MIRRLPAVLLWLFAATLHGQETVPVAATPNPEPPKLDPILQQDIWGVTLPEFVIANPHSGFRWVSSAHDTAENTEPGLSLFQIPVYQAIIRFGNEKLKEIDVSFYNRGDGGAMPREKFESLRDQCAKAITDLTKLKPVERGRDATSAVKATGLSWQTDKSLFLLEWSSSKATDATYRAEFLRLTITAAEKPKGLLETSLAASHPAGAKFNGPDHVKKLPNGDVLIADIPMVDQGEKGYCAVASTERVVRYYGGKVDANELAQIANTSAEEGTSPTAMFDSLQKLTSRLHIKIRTLEDFNSERFMKLFNDYDVAAKRGRRADELNMKVEEITAIFKQMKPDILREVRTKNPSDMNRFFRTIQTHVNDGIPPLWSLMIGILPEPKDPEGFGGHMRLIIGYNAQTNEILYSDSWGYGHELKRMPLSDAWTMTTGLRAIEPL